jgi:hypothetical protein
MIRHTLLRVQAAPSQQRAYSLRDTHFKHAMLFNVQQGKKH